MPYRIDGSTDDVQKVLDRGCDRRRSSRSVEGPCHRHLSGGHRRGLEIQDAQTGERPAPRRLNARCSSAALAQRGRDRFGANGGSLHPIEAYPLVLFLADTGARLGEASALRWVDLDLERGTARIARSFSGGRYVTVTKTGRERVLDPCRGAVPYEASRRPE